MTSNMVTLPSAHKIRRRLGLPFGILATLICVVRLSGCGGGSQPTGPRLSIVTATLPNGISGAPYVQSISASGGVPPYHWMVSAGTLPHDLALTSEVSGGATVSGTPDLAAQAVKFTVQVTDSAHQSTQQSYTVSILLSADSLGLSADQMNFGLFLVGTSSNKQTETLTNNSNSDLAIQSIAVRGTNASDYSSSSTCAGVVLAGGSSCAIDVTFTPGQVGPSTASIEITDDTAGSPHSFALSGSGAKAVPDATLSATSIDFGNQSIDTTSLTQSLTVSNYGTGAVSISSIPVSAPFAQTNTCSSSLAPGASCTINVTFHPTASGDVTGTLSVNDNASDSPQTVSLAGVGVAGLCVPRGMQCRSNLPCCAGLSCVSTGLRGRCQ